MLRLFAKSSCKDLLSLHTWPFALCVLGGNAIPVWLPFDQLGGAQRSRKDAICCSIAYPGWRMSEPLEYRLHFLAQTGIATVWAIRNHFGDAVPLDRRYYPNQLLPHLLPIVRIV